MADAKKGKTQKEKLEHYTQVAKGAKAVKAESKFSEAEQRAYARGQRDARNESNRMYAYSKATPKQREEYKKAQAARKAEYQAMKESMKAGAPSYLDY